MDAIGGTAATEEKQVKEEIEKEEKREEEVIGVTVGCVEAVRNGGEVMETL